MKRMLALLGLLAVVGCKASMPPEVLQSYQARTLFTCCNIHYEGDEISDANYWVGSTLPAGTPVQVVAAGRNSVTFDAEGRKLTLVHQYGKDQESMQQYLDKVFVGSDPRGTIATYSRSAQDAIREGRVERGMTKEQVLASVGYPPVHRTTSTSMNEWLFWYNRWVTYKVQFDDSGKVTNVVGRPAPTRDQEVVADAPPLAPASHKAPAAKSKKK
jgi:hypothetical protein